MSDPNTSPADRGLPFFVLPTADGNVRVVPRNVSLPDLWDAMQAWDEADTRNEWTIHSHATDKQAVADRALAAADDVTEELAETLTPEQARALGWALVNAGEVRLRHGAYDPQAPARLRPVSGEGK